MDKKIGIPNDGLGIGQSAPSAESASKKRVIVGVFPFLCAEGKEFFELDVRFQDGDLFHPILDGLLYIGDELSIGGRKFPRKEGYEFWVVRRGAKKEVVGIERHCDAPNVKSFA